MDRAGLVGADGATHAGSFDSAYLGCLPGIVVMAAADEAELMHMIATAGRHRRPPVRGALSARRRHRRRHAGARRAAGSARAASCARARMCAALVRLAAEPIAGGRHAREPRPLDDGGRRALRQAARRRAGAAACARARGARDRRGGRDRRLRHPRAADAGRARRIDRGLKVRSLVLPDLFIDQDSPPPVVPGAGPDPKGIGAKVFEALGREVAAAPSARVPARRP